MAEGKALDYFLDLVKIAAPSMKEERVADFIIKTVNGKVDIVKKDSFGNVYVSIDGKGRPIFFIAHMDTVEPCDGAKPIVEDGYVKSDGKTILGADDKASIGVMLALIEELGGKEHRPIEFVFFRSEESGNLGAINFDYGLLKAKEGFCFDSSTAVGTIITASPYYDSFNLKVIGRTSHASRPKEGVNALLIFSEALQKIKLGELDEETLMNIGIVESGHARNAVPGEVIARGEIRGFTHERMKMHAEKLKETIESTVSKYNARYELDIIRENPGYKDIDKTAHELFVYAKNAILSLGLTPTIGPPWGVSDANILNDGKGLVCINLGYGAEMTHSKEERIKVSALSQLQKLMLKLVQLKV